MTNRAGTSPKKKTRGDWGFSKTAHVVDLQKNDTTSSYKQRREPSEESLESPKYGKSIKSKTQKES